MTEVNWKNYILENIKKSPGKCSPRELVYRTGFTTVRSERLFLFQLLDLLDVGEIKLDGNLKLI